MSLDSPNAKYRKTHATKGSDLCYVVIVRHFFAPGGGLTNASYLLCKPHSCASVPLLFLLITEARSLLELGAGCGTAVATTSSFQAGVGTPFGAHFGRPARIHFFLYDMSVGLEVSDLTCTRSLLKSTTHIL